MKTLKVKYTFVINTVRQFALRLSDLQKTSYKMDGVVIFLSNTSVIYTMFSLLKQVVPGGSRKARFPLPLQILLRAVNYVAES